MGNLLGARSYHENYLVQYGRAQVNYLSMGEHYSYSELFEYGRVLVNYLSLVTTVVNYLSMGEH
jgi:hypothetical protein